MSIRKKFVDLKYEPTVKTYDDTLDVDPYDMYERRERSIGHRPTSIRTRPIRTSYDQAVATDLARMRRESRAEVEREELLSVDEITTAPDSDWIQVFYGIDSGTTSES